MSLSADIVAAVAEGCETSVEIARRLGRRRDLVGVMLASLADEGAVVRAGRTSRGSRGRPCVRWRLGAAS